LAASARSELIEDERGLASNTSIGAQRADAGALVVLLPFHSWSWMVGRRPARPALQRRQVGRQPRLAAWGRRRRPPAVRTPEVDPQPLLVGDQPGLLARQQVLDALRALAAALLERELVQRPAQQAAHAHQQLQPQRGIAELIDHQPEQLADVSELVGARRQHGRPPLGQHRLGHHRHLVDRIALEIGVVGRDVVALERGRGAGGRRGVDALGRGHRRVPSQPARHRAGRTTARIGCARCAGPAQ
jgi:hypothetical protein